MDALFADVLGSVFFFRFHGCLTDSLFSSQILFRYQLGIPMPHGSSYVGDMACFFVNPRI